MTLRERVLYHQIHPLKLATDWITGLAATWLLWSHQLALALLVGLIPPVLVSIAVMKKFDLERYKESPLGRYVAKHMTPGVERVRFIGLIIMWVGAWFNVVPAVCVGLAVIIAGWCKGVVFP